MKKFLKKLIDFGTKDINLMFFYYLQVPQRNSNDLEPDKNSRTKLLQASKRHKIHESP